MNTANPLIWFVAGACFYCALREFTSGNTRSGHIGMALTVALIAGDLFGIYA